MIHVIDDWYIDVDDSQYVSGKISYSKDGKERLSRKNYHGNIVGAVQRIEREVKRDGLRNKSIEIKDALNILINCNARFVEILECIRKKV